VYLRRGREHARSGITLSSFSSPRNCCQPGDRTIDRYSTECVLALSGSYEGSWDSITRLLHELARQHATCCLHRHGRRRVHRDGPGPSAGDPPTYRGVVAGSDVGWTSAKAYGVTLGQGEALAALRDGELTIPVTAIPATIGQVRLGGAIDLRTPDRCSACPARSSWWRGPDHAGDRQASAQPDQPHLRLHEPRRGHTVVGDARRARAAKRADQAKRQRKGRLDMKDFKVQFGGPMAVLIELGALDHRRCLR